MKKIGLLYLARTPEGPDVLEFFFPPLVSVAPVGGLRDIVFWPAATILTLVL
jgi:hypothetical protein